MFSDMKAPTKERDLDLDVVKGILVLIMITYHCASITLEFNVWRDAIRIMSRVNFIHFAFIMISGYLCGWYYMPRLVESPEGVRKRLVVRGGKLLIIFLSINLILYSTGWVYSFGKLLSQIKSLEDVVVNFIINMNGELAAFEVLYYIAVFLLIASIALGGTRLIAFVIMVLIFVLVNPASNTLRFLMFGLIGVFGGIIAGKESQNKIWKFLERTWGLPVLLLFVLYQIYLTEIRLIMSPAALQVLSYSIEASLWFVLFIFLLRVPGFKSLRNVITLFGRYILFGYIVQMFLIRIGYMLLMKIGIQGLSYYVINWIVSAIMLYLLILALDYLRNRLDTVDRAYRLVFA